MTDLPLFFLLIAALLCAAMATAWLIAKRSANAGWIDVVWTYATGLAGVAVALIPAATHEGPSLRQIIVAGLVALWALRLGTYVAIRVATGPEDRRYVELREEWGASFFRRMFWFLQLQAVCSVLLGVSIYLAAHNPAPGLRWTDLCGIAILLIAILGEALADRQLARFKAAGADPGAVCDAGLWRWSRHPNYFFEWFGWLAYPVMAIGAGHAAGWFALIGPSLMYAILVHGTGIPPLEAHMLRSRGAAYRRYQQRTNRFFPGPAAAD